jgi:hypothetical protein
MVTDRSKAAIDEIGKAPGEWLYHYTTLERALVVALEVATRLRATDRSAETAADADDGQAAERSRIAAGLRRGLSLVDDEGESFPPRASNPAQSRGRCAWQESNLRPRAPEARALSPELQALGGQV